MEKKNKKSHLKAKGMHCASCVQTIEKALKKHRGVKEANVNFATEKAYIVYYSNLIDKKATHRNCEICRLRALNANLLRKTEIVQEYRQSENNSQT